MQRTHSTPWWDGRRWTLALVVAMTVANLGLAPQAPDSLRSLVGWLEYDRQAIAAGQVWRLVTGNLVHWSIEHFLLDVGAFLVVGCMYEPTVRRTYPWALLLMALAVGGTVLLALPEMRFYRGLSGVDSGQFVAALYVEAQWAKRAFRRWLWLAPVVAMFATKILWETATGAMFFGTESLGDIGLPVPLAHLAGAMAGVCCLSAKTHDGTKRRTERASWLASGSLH